MHRFRPASGSKWLAFGLIGGAAAILVFNIAVSVSPSGGPLGMRVLFVTFWSFILSIAIWGGNGLMATITIRPDRIERKSWFGLRVIRWDRLEELRRLDRADSRFFVKGDGTNFDVNWTGYEKKNQLQRLLLEKLKEGELGLTFRWRLISQPFIAVIGGLFAVICFASGAFLIYGGLRWEPKVFYYGMAAFMIFGGILLAFLLTAVHEVTERGVRADPILGWRRELRFEQIALIEFGVVGEYGEGEAMYIYGPGVKLAINANSTPRYAQVRDMILARVKCDVKGFGFLRK